jgi:hypothetical protein
MIDLLAQSLIVELFLPSVIIDFYFLDQFIIFAVSHAWQ